MSGADELDAERDPKHLGDGDQPSRMDMDSTDAGGRATVNNKEQFKYAYNMTNPKRGMAVIINNRIFDRRTQMGERTGTDVDAANLYQVFKKLGFEVHMFNNQKTTEMLRIMSEASHQDHSSSDCFACAILSHGEEGMVYGTDGIIQIDTLVAPFRGDRCTQLAGKPKLFFIQACRGSQLDHGVEVADADSEEKPHRIPSEADFLMAYSTVPGYFSWRNSTRGSWFVQALVKVFQEYAMAVPPREILWMMTRVNRAVAYEFESNASKEFMNKKKQIPCIVSMLTKELYFTDRKT